MPADVARRALDPFFTTKESGKGTGLGLAIVAGFVAQSGGETRVESIEGEGTTVRMRFPGQSEREHIEAPDKQEWTPVARSGEVLLVVEDDAQLRSMFERLLRGLGYEVISAEDGRRGLALAASTPQLDLVLSDCVLPGDVDGYALARQLRRTQPELPVLLMSGYADPQIPHAEQPELLPVRLTKPLKRAELARAIRATIDRRDTR